MSIKCTTDDESQEYYTPKALKVIKYMSDGSTSRKFLSTRFNK